MHYTKQSMSIKMLMQQNCKVLDIRLLTRTNIRGFLKFTPCKAEQPLRGMELQEKEAQEGQRIQELCLEENFS